MDHLDTRRDVQPLYGRVRDPYYIRIRMSVLHVSTPTKNPATMPIHKGSKMWNMHRAEKEWLNTPGV